MGRGQGIHPITQTGEVDLRTVLSSAVVVGAVGGLLVGCGVSQPADQTARPNANDPVTHEEAASLLPEANLIGTDEIPATIPVLEPGAGSGAPPIDRAKLLSATQEALADPGLGPNPAVVVVDAATGQEVLGRRATAAQPAASAQKLLTALAVLGNVPADERLTTSVVGPGSQEGSTQQIVLVGGGDATMTVNPVGVDYPQTASLADLAKRTAQQLRRSGVESVALGFDDRAFSGPTRAPGWSEELLGLGLVAPVSALSVRERVRGPVLVTGGDPARAAADVFATLLRARGLEVSSVSAASAPDSEASLAQVQSGPMIALVRRMLTESDNNLAESLLRVAARASGRAGSFAGGGAAVREALARLDLPRSGLTVADGSGLSRSNRVSATTLARLAAASTSTKASIAERISGLQPGLAVAGFTGTLADRFANEPQADGRVFGKTGTLTGLTTLTGLANTKQGRLLAFSVIASGDIGTDQARAAADAFAATLVECGCQ